MFTGIIEETAIVKLVKHWPNLSVLGVQTRQIWKGLRLGDSVAVNGVCLTVTQVSKGLVTFDLMKETLVATTLESLNKGNKVNLERALALGSRLGGHLVTGHVDGVGVVTNVIKQKNYTELVIAVPSRLRKYLVPKGSICVQGVSLTVGKIQRSSFSVYLIPFTLKVTNFVDIRSGQQVNLETDLVAKYILGAK